MKFLTENHELDLLANALSFSSPSLRVTTRIEAYSCKPVSKEKKIFKQLDQSLFSDISLSVSLSPPDQKDGLVDSAFGPLDRKDARKTFWLMIATLNLAYPDYDFTNVRPDEFKKETNAKVVMAPLSNILSRSASPHPSFSGYPSHQSPLSQKGDTYLSRNPFSFLPDSENQAHPFLHQILNPVIGLFTPDCEVFSWMPDVESDPHAFDSDDEDDETENGEDLDDDLQFGMMDWDVPPSPATPRRMKGGMDPRTPLSDDQRQNWLLDYDGSGGLLWSTHYFFYNRKMKRVLFLSVWGKKVQPGLQISKPRPDRGRFLSYEGRNKLAVKQAIDMFCTDTSSPDESPPKESLPLPRADSVLVEFPPTRQRDFKRSASTSSLSKQMGRNRKRAKVGA